MRPTVASSGSDTDPPCAGTACGVSWQPLQSFAGALARPGGSCTTRSLVQLSETAQCVLTHIQKLVVKRWRGCPFFDQLSAHAFTSEQSHYFQEPQRGDVETRVHHGVAVVWSESVQVLPDAQRQWAVGGEYRRFIAPNLLSKFLNLSPHELASYNLRHRASYRRSVSISETLKKIPLSF